jgi:hypothetical protein
MTKKSMIQEMAELVKEHVNGWQSDFEIDKGNLSVKGEFIWILRENGTHLYSMREEDYPGLNETVRYLFGTANGRSITKGNLKCLEESHDNARVWYHIRDGVLTKITKRIAVAGYAGFIRNYTRTSTRTTANA